MKSPVAQSPSREAITESKQGVGPGLWLLLAVALVAFGLRVWHLGAQSIWLDEGISALFSNKPPGDLLSTVIAEDLHPPAYYFILHYWMRLAGSSEFAMRFVSVAAGFLAIPCVYQLTRWLLLAGRRPRVGAVPVWGGGLAAGMAALSPFLVYYSQEARNYMMVTLFTIVASLALFKGQECSLAGAPRRVRVKWWLAYVVFATLTLYTNYVGALLLVAHGLYLCLLCLRRRRLPLMGTASLAITGVLYVPWLKPALLQLLRVQATPDFWAGSMSLEDLLQRLFVAFSLGPKAQGAAPALIAFAAVLVLGLVSLVRIRKTPLGRSELFLLLYLLVPLAAVYGIASQAPKFAERYVIMAAPAFYLLVARGLSLLLVYSKALLGDGRRSGRILEVVFVAASLAVAVPSAFFTYQVLNSPDFIRDNNRAAVAYIEAYSKPGDVIVLMMNAPHAFQYYYQGDLPWYGLQPGDNFPAAAAELNRMTEGKERLWIYLWNADWADPAGFVLDSLDAAGPRARPDVHFPGVEVRTYSLASKPLFSADFQPRQRVGANFENKVELIGYDPPAEGISSDREGAITLYWKALQPLKDEYVVSLRLKKGGSYWGSREVRPTSYYYPTTSWRPGLPIRGRVALSPLPGTPPGEYQVEVSFHNVSATIEGRDLAVLGPGGTPRGTSIVVGTVQVSRPASPPPLTSLGAEVREPASPPGDTIALAGAQTVARAVRPGDEVPLTLFWKAPARVPEARKLSITLLDSSGKVMPLYNDHPVLGTYPADKWQPGEVVRDQYLLSVPLAAAPGPASLQVSIAAASGGEGGASVIARLDIQERVRPMVRPEGIEHAVDATFEKVARLVGYDLSAGTARPGETLRLTLYWQAIEHSDTPYTVFTHVLNPENIIIAQKDNPPVNGTYPTTAWAPGEYVSDAYQLAIPTGTPAGDYDVETGLYVSPMGKRLSITSAGRPLEDDRVILGKVRIEP